PPRADTSFLRDVPVPKSRLWSPLRPRWSRLGPWNWSSCVRRDAGPEPRQRALAQPRTIASPGPAAGAVQPARGRPGGAPGVGGGTGASVGAVTPRLQGQKYRNRCTPTDAVRDALCRGKGGVGPPSTEDLMTATFYTMSGSSPPRPMDPRRPDVTVQPVEMP